MGTRIDVALVVAVAVVLVGLAVYTRLDLRDFTRFRTLTETRARQRSFRRWLLTSLGLFGASTVLLLLLTPRAAVGEVRVAARTGPALDSLVAELESDPASFHATLVGLVAAFLVGGVVSLLALRRKPELLTTPVAALIPRTRAELPWGAALSVNAGVVEELLFRLALPAALYALLVPLGLGATTAGLVAFGLSALLFGAMHYYQGVGGVALTLVLGLFFTVLYVLTESIALVITLHTLLDLRTLLLLPLIVGKVHRTTTAS